MLNIIQKTSIIIFVFCLILPTTIVAGSSIFGFGPQLLGEVQNQYSTAASGRGGFAMAVEDSMSLNQTNFALWSTLSRTTLSLTLGFQGLSTQTKYDQISSLNASFNGGFLAIPIIKKKIAMGIGLIPKLKNDFSVIIPNVGIGAAATQKIKVIGNMSEAKFIFSYAISPNLSFAIIPNYSFGFVSDQISITYNDISYGDINLENKFKIYGPGLALGAFLRLNQKLTTGAQLRLPSKLSLDREQISSSSTQTINEHRNANFPLQATIGFVYRMSYRWQMGLDIDYKNWKNGYKIDNITVGNLNDSYRVGIGVERLPELKRMVSKIEEMTYRGGFFLGQLARTFNSKPVYDYGISIGVGVPIIKNHNRIDIAFEYGNRGNLDINLVKESYFRFNISLSANELWFVREDL